MYQKVDRQISCPEHSTLVKKGITLVGGMTEEAKKKTKIHQASEQEINRENEEIQEQSNQSLEPPIPPVLIDKVNLKDDCFLQKRIYCRECKQDIEQLIDYETVLRFLEKEYLKSNIIDTSLLSLKLNLENLRKAIIFQFDYMMKIIDQIGSEKRQIQINENLLKDFLNDPRDNYMSIHNLLQDVSRKVIIDKDKKISLRKEYYNKFEFDILTDLKKCCKIYEDTIASVTDNTHIAPPVFELRPVRIPDISLMKEFEVEQYAYQYEPEEPKKQKLIVQQSQKGAKCIALNLSCDILCISASQDNQNSLQFIKLNQIQNNCRIDCQDQCNQIEFIENDSFFCIEKNQMKHYIIDDDAEGKIFIKNKIHIKAEKVNCYTVSNQRKQSILVATGCGKEIFTCQVLQYKNEQWQELVTFSSQSEITCLQFNSQDDLLIAGCLDGALLIYENSEGFWKFKQLIKKHSSPIKFLSFTSENDVISATFNQIFVWPNKKLKGQYLFAYEIEKKPHYFIQYSKSHLVIGYSNLTAIFRLEGDLMILEHTYNQKSRLAQLNGNILAVGDQESIKTSELKN